MRNLLDNSTPRSNSTNSHTIGLLTNRQRLITKGHLIDSNTKSYGIFPAFSPLNPKFLPGHHIIDNFSNQFSFNLVNKNEKEINKIHAQELDEMVLCNSSLPNLVLMITDASIKNDIAMSISHIHSVNRPLIKTVHHALFVTSMEAELFTIRYGINQACSIENTSKIIIITDSIHVAKKIFNSESHPFQIHTSVILSELRKFFNSNNANSIEFWECPSRIKWRFHHNVNKNSKSFMVTPIYPCKISWNFCKKSDSDDIIKQWKMTFQVSKGKGNHFLDLLDDNLNSIEPSYIKGGQWLQMFVRYNLLCAHATRVISNHAPIGEYRLQFFPSLDFSCPCNNYPIKTRRHILYECKRFNGYWNPRRDMLKHFIMFLTANPNAFAFNDN